MRYEELPPEDLKRPVVLCCHPVSPVAQRRLVLRTGGRYYGPYADSTKATCRRCAEEVYVGPRQRVTLQNIRPEPLVMCFECAADVGGGWGTIAHLGNPEKGAADGLV